METSHTRSTSVASSAKSNPTAAEPGLDFLAERVGLLYQGMYTAVVVNVSIALLVMWGLWGRVSHTKLLVWLAMLALATLLRGVLTLYYSKARPHGHQLQAWLVAIIFANTLAALTWGLSIWVFQPFQDFQTPLLLTFMLGGLAAGAMALHVIIIAGYILYIVSVVGPITLWYFLQPSTDYQLMSLMLLVFILAMLATGVIYRRVLLRSMRLSHQLAKAKQAAEAANKSKTLFLSKLSHELRTPLNAILGFSQLLKLSENQTPQDQENIDDIIRGGLHLQRLIDELLDIAKIEAGIVDIYPEPVDCGQLIGECIDQVRPLASELALTIDFDANQARGLLCWADPHRMRQILYNLLSNACKYNRQQGRVSVSCMPVDEQKIRIEVGDTGVGIDPQYRDKVFQAYQRLGFEKSRIKGTGLGLVIVRQLVEIMGGSIDYTSQVNQGSTFSVLLPRHQP